jgi:hypothetical protein
MLIRLALLYADTVQLAPDRSFIRAPGHYRSHIKAKDELELGLCQHILGLILSTF